MYRLTCFGEVSILGPDAQLIRLRSQKHIALLTYLAANRRRAHDRDTLATLFWESPIERARHSLSQALYDIRKKLDPGVLRCTASRVRFAANHLTYDGHALEEAVRAERFAAAVDLYEGGFAPGLDAVATGDFERWVEGERRRLDELARIALRRRIEISYSEGRWSEMYIAATKLVNLDPLDESAHRAVIQALWLHGDQQGSLRHYDELARLLKVELGAEPDDETMSLVSRIRTSRPHASASATHARAELPLVGRREEFAVLQRAAHAVESLEARLVYMDGEAGIGKTRLVNEFARSMNLAGLRVLSSRCYSAESDAAYVPVLEGIREIVSAVTEKEQREAGRYHQLGHLFPEYPGLMAKEVQVTKDPEVSRRRMYEEVADVMRRSFGPRTVWIIEDVHWIDASSASLLHYLLRRLRKHPLLLVITSRSHVELTEAARKLLDDARSNLHCDEIPLRPLKPDEIESMIRLASKEPDPEVVEASQRFSGGNPFYALEIARSLMEAKQSGAGSRSSAPITPKLRDLLAFRVEGLSRDAARILESVAVLERQAAPTRVADMTGLTLSAAADAATPLYRRRLLEDSPNGLAFPHDIVREYVYDNLGSLKRTALHLRAGELLTEESSANPAIVARHFAMGGDKRRAFEFAIRAAENSAASSAHEEAARMAELAADCALAEQERVAALSLVARSRFALAHYRAAARTAMMLLTSNAALTNLECAELWLLIARSVEPTRAEDASRFLTKAVEAAQRIEEPRHRYSSVLEVLHWHLRFAWNLADHEAATSALTRIETVRQDADTAGLLTPAIESRALCSLAAYYTFYESSRRALSLINRATAMSDRLTPEMQLRTLKLAGAINTRLADYDQAEGRTKEALKIAEALSDTSEIATLLNNVAGAVIDRGDWAQVESAAGRVIGLENMLPNPLQIADSIRINLADSYFYQGRFADAETVISEAMRLPRSLVTRDRRAGLLSLRGLIQLRLGKMKEARSTWSHVLRCSPLGLRGEPHRYKIEWLRHGLDRNEIDGPRLLCQAASEERDLEFSNFLKLRWLRFALYDGAKSCDHGKQVSELRQELETVGLGWFVGFTLRWVQHARSAPFPRAGTTRKLST